MILANTATFVNPTWIPMVKNSGGLITVLGYPD
jgi:hypothetical protein